MSDWKRIGVRFLWSAGFGLAAGVAGFVCFRFASQPPDALLLILFCAFVAGMQQRTIARLVRQNEVLQASNLSLSCNSSAAALAAMQTSQQHQQAPQYVPPNAPTFRS